MLPAPAPARCGLGQPRLRTRRISLVLGELGLRLYVGLRHGGGGEAAGAWLAWGEHLLRPALGTGRQWIRAALGLPFPCRGPGVSPVRLRLDQAMRWGPGAALGSGVELASAPRWALCAALSSAEALGCGAFRGRQRHGSCR